MRWAILLVLGVMLGILLLGNSRAAIKHGADAIPPGFTVIHYWEHWSGNEAAVMQNIVDEFNATVGMEKKIHVEFLSQSNIDQKVMLATAAGIPPDIAGLWDKPLPQWAALDALEPLDELAKAHGIGEDYYKPVYWNACHWNGKLIALLSTPNDVALIWNKRSFAYRATELRAAGLDPTSPPHTLEELMRYATVLTTKSPDGRIRTAGYLPTEPGWYILQMPFWFGGSLYDPVTHKLTLTNPRTVEAYRWVASYTRRFGKAAIFDFHSTLGNYNSASNPFLTGQLAMELQGPWIGNTISQFMPASGPHVDWGAAPLPSLLTADAKTDDERINHGVTWCGFDALTIPRGSKHKAEAFEFIAYVNRMDIMEKLCAAHCKGTPLTKHSDTWYTSHPNPYVEMFDRLASSPNAVSSPPCPIWPQVCDDLTAFTQRVALLEVEPKAGLEVLQKRLQERLDQFEAAHPQ